MISDIGENAAPAVVFVDVGAAVIPVAVVPVPPIEILSVESFPAYGLRRVRIISAPDPDTE